MSRFRELQYFGHWRPYHRAALSAFERARHHGATKMHIVAPPGSGNRLLGVELIRRLGRRTLVLAPNQTTQQQWPRAVGNFTQYPKEWAGADELKPIACFSYQQLCEFDDPELVLARLEQSRADEEAEPGLEDLLSTGALERVQRLASMQVGVVVLDECHHLASLWGHVIRPVIEALGEVFVVGLTATPPVGLPEAEMERYDALLGAVDFTVPTPAVVRDGHLAPYQELAWLTEPRADERDWLADHDVRFRELTASLREDSAFADWVRRRPDLAAPAARFLHWAGRPATLRGEAYRQPPGLEDWRALLEDYAVRCLAGADSPEATDRYEEIAGALRELGFELTPDGIRSERPDADRLLTGSRAKADAMVEVIAGEAQLRGERLRALVLCDAELAAPRPDDALTGVLDPAAATARYALQALAADDRTAGLRPLLVSDRGLRCMPADADALLEALRADERFTLPEWTAEVDGVLVSLASSGAEWMPRVWLELATALLVEGVTRVVVGTRELLGEGWTVPPLNVLVDLTTARTGASVQQIRGRTLRLDRADPEKVASNWEIVCAAPGLVRGRVDYARFADKHLQVFAPAPDGAIVAGPEHAHPELGRWAPPPAERFAAINAEQLARAGDREGARRRWRVGTSYRGVELPVLLARADAPLLALEDAARAVAEAYHELGELSADAAGSLTLTPLADGFTRCELSAADQAEGRCFVAALDELCAGVEELPPYLITLSGAKGLLGRMLKRPAPGGERLHPVPSDFARDPERAQAFARSWRRHVGQGQLVEDPQARPVAGGYETLVRAIWV